MYDISFLSHSETLAETHWERLHSRYPRARRVHGVDGIVAAHQRAAALCDTSWFWVVDADNVVSDDFHFDFKFPRDYRVWDTVTVWRAKNNVNGLEYGYGGIKLMPRRRLLALSPGVVDMTTSIGDNFRIEPTVASTTIIDSSPYEAWRSAFRECAKLSSKTIINRVVEEDERRLEVWSKEGESPYLCRVHHGAAAGIQFGIDHGGDVEQLKKLNDYSWLRSVYATYYGVV